MKEMQITMKSKYEYKKEWQNEDVFHWISPLVIQNLKHCNHYSSPKSENRLINIYDDQTFIPTYTQLE